MNDGDREFVEKCAEAVHKAYCKRHEKREGRPYWTGGDYSKLDEDMKDVDRDTVRAVLLLVNDDRDRLRRALDVAVEGMASAAAVFAGGGTAGEMSHDINEARLKIKRIMEDNGTGSESESTEGGQE